ncbi:hypothetical protein [Lyngbya aestuarii]|nr:hypothetical protein [Lyngbya aestuarii]
MSLMFSTSNNNNLGVSVAFLWDRGDRLITQYIEEYFSSGQGGSATNYK